MIPENQFSNFINELSVQTKMENIWSNTCRSWENCNETNIQAFLSLCNEYHIDPQYCLSWVEQHSAEILNWETVSKTSLEWINQHSSAGSSFSILEDPLS